MRNIVRTSLVVIGSAALVGTMALPASAADVIEGTNTATVEIQSGFLVLDTTAAALTLTHSGASATTSTATGELTGVNVSDMNSDGLGWDSTAVLTDLTDAATGVIDTSLAEYTSTVTASEGTIPTGAGNTVTAADGGNNTATWNTSIVVNVPNTTTGGTYTGTLTHSLS
ncbi:hypothetical protein [Arthrobacter sp. KK5.5]|uniref:hypothetical protein n=1 Tax=Arthrobacter sp. KK5.5 TaxID=3373084 RepID=UPI003EE75EDB